MLISPQLDSIKWYKDGREFYRLHPHNQVGLPSTCAQDTLHLIRLT